MTSLAERISVERITVEARQVRAGRTLLTLLAGCFFLIGWTTAKVLGAIWLGLAWAGTAVRLGWQEARENGSTRRPAG